MNLTFIPRKDKITPRKDKFIYKFNNYPKKRQLSLEKKIIPRKEKIIPRKDKFIYKFNNYHYKGKIILPKTNLFINLTIIP